MFFQVVLQKSIPPQIRELVRDIIHSKGLVDGFVGKLTYAKRLEKHLVQDEIGLKIRLAPL